MNQAETVITMPTDTKDTYLDPNTDKLKLFIADDQRLIRDWLKTVCAEIPHVKVVGEADTTLKTIRGINAKKPEVVILDIRMPGNGGMHILSKIKTRKPAPIVIVFTAQLEPYYRDLCLDLGADYFFSKTQEFDQIEAVIEKLQEAKQAGLPPLDLK